MTLSAFDDEPYAGLDLSELTERSVAQGIVHSRGWHAVMDRIQFGRVTVVAVLHGAVVGGGLGLACGRRWPSSSTSRRCWSTGCRGTTLSAATTTSA